MISGAIGLEFTGISTYFLTGSDISNEVGVNNKLIFDTANYYKQRGCRALNLGGGISSRPGLKRFKKTFSKNVLQFNISKHIYDSEKYNRYASGNGGSIRDASFFPAYRDQ
jgi:lipid II:glycine glycyltransferase (peptidoglycan interpeptide bridge formation enzyme)